MPTSRSWNRSIIRRHTGGLPNGGPLPPRSIDFEQIKPWGGVRVQAVSSARPRPGVPRAANCRPGVRPGCPGAECSAHRPPVLPGPGTTRKNIARPETSPTARRSVVSPGRAARRRASRSGSGSMFTPRQPRRSTRFLVSQPLTGSPAPTSTEKPPRPVGEGTHQHDVLGATGVRDQVIRAHTGQHTSRSDRGVGQPWESVRTVAGVSPRSWWTSGGRPTWEDSRGCLCAGHRVTPVSRARH